MLKGKHEYYKLFTFVKETLVVIKKGNVVKKSAELRFLDR